MVDRHESRSLPSEIKTPADVAAYRDATIQGRGMLPGGPALFDQLCDFASIGAAQSEIALKWRPVSEEPPCANRYIVTLTYPDGETRVQERYFATSRKWDSEYVTHWMHMPMPAVEANRHGVSEEQ